MADHTDIHMTPGRSAVQNPFESPNDYRHLQEPLVPSPSVFKSRATPTKFTWNVEELASLFPVDIDPEEIQRQSFYLSQTRADSDIEEKRQNAIEQFFTKGAIVPSPWSVSETRKIPLMYKKSPLSPMITEEPEKHSVSCQTTLSLPLALDLESLLGEYYRSEEMACDAVQESLSSSSLRRKLFLDGQGAFSSSDGSSPPTPDRGPTQEERLLLKRHEDAAQDFKGAASSSFASPLSCNVTASTPSTAQFSSSPIQRGRFRDCSLGSLASPVFPDRSSPASMSSPTISPILAHTPKGSAEWKQLRNLTPHGVTVDMDTPSCAKSPFVEGCSPIRSCSPHHLRIHPDLQQCARSKPRSRFRSWGSPPLISPVLNPRLPDSQDSEDLTHSSSSSAPTNDVDPSSSLDQNTCSPGRVSLGLLEPVKTEPDREIRMEGQIGEEDEEADNGVLSGQLTSSRMVNTSATESSQMFVSLLGDGSSIRYDSSMQVDSGYNTTSGVQVDSGYNTTSAGASSLIDGLGSDWPGKESFTSNFPDDAFHLTRTSKVKARFPHH
ncbi:protein aurora borealis isoform X2 [Nerophis ophidion]|uniref:protein aurora borealis isoform X2 n=1 Tax=Nerophis ophidion TaxID=159077 RepID=UPI002ADF1FCF|nr:protein aurora borealis isoform X2 [Nerophis ophidion]